MKAKVKSPMPTKNPPIHFGEIGRVRRRAVKVIKLSAGTVPSQKKNKRLAPRKVLPVADAPTMNPYSHPQGRRIERKPTATREDGRAFGEVHDDFQIELRHFFQNGTEKEKAHPRDLAPISKREMAKTKLETIETVR